MIAVVMIHSKTASSGDGCAAWNAWLQSLLGYSLPSFAVPFFFIVSGMFFALKPCGYAELLKKKFRTLLVPYLAWTVIVALLVLPLTMTNNYMTHRALLERTAFGQGSFFACADALFGITQRPKGNVPMWFVRSLIVLFVFAPLWQLLRRGMRGWLLVPAVACALACPYYMIPFIAVPVRAVAYFLIGVSIAGKMERVDWVVRKVWVVSGLFYFVLAVLKLQLPSWCFHFVPFCGVLFWLGFYDVVLAKRLGDVPSFAKKTFWVYCLHSFWCNWLLAVVSFCFAGSDVVRFCMFFVIPAIAIVGSLIVGRFAECMLPRLYACLVGGRM